MLILKDFGISFAERKLLDDINLKIPEGCIFHLKGPNASGKSSLLNAISGIIPVTFFWEIWICKQFP
jgi:ABC-type cobalamin/Fe3+-siderophores transport system ATPase subunit